MSSPSNNDKKILPPENSELPTDTEQFIFEQVQKSYDDEYDRMKALDNKTNNLLGLIGIILSVILAGNGILFTDLAKDNTPKSITEVETQVLSAILVFLALALGLGCGALWLVNYETAPNSYSLMQYYSEGNKRTAVIRTTASLANATSVNERKNNFKAYLMMAMLIAFLIAMVLSAVFIYLIAVKFTD